MSEIIIIGEILVEVMAKHLNQRFDQTGEFLGPFPSGAPAIFIDQATKTGSSCAIVAKVGNDGFGRLNIERLQRDGVDVQYIQTVAEKTTGIAFVTYRENGDREFIFTLKDSAAACINRQDITEAMFQGCKYYQINGCSAFNEEMMATIKKAVFLAKAQNARIAFDPNIRKELLEDENFKQFIDFILKNTDVFLPGEEELRFITGLEDEEQAVRKILEQNVRYVVVKRGKRGCRVYDQQSYFDAAPFQVEEVDPTGAGDCFAGTLISLLNQGKSIQEAVLFANAAGAYAVTQKGPMEGTATLEELKAFMRSKGGETRCL
ncbi:sugar kinase [Desulforamulus ruminis]|uniref:PfkB domain protein n=1 Tax=Desulforamulus ruminis (strain ATCC 23193 / DSM 2154 / NCIMB 8452 / DL) TaxID=696281 RepID=F6DQM4_DESRL|nr:sugar kinase [Desulforamulus ruminis]AEG62021.1 PfkB domain protein [Desulforamulus ruminis DSM 2154]